MTIVLAEEVLELDQTFLEDPREKSDDDSDDETMEEVHQPIRGCTEWMLSPFVLSNGKLCGPYDLNIG